MTKSQPSRIKKMLGYNFGIVYRFEVVRTLKKPSFWLSIVALPALFAIIFGISYLSGKTTDDTQQKLAEEHFSLAITDDSRTIDNSIISQMKATEVSATDKDAAIDQVKNGKLDAYFYYPKDLATDKVEVYAKDVGLFDRAKYNTVAKQLLASSVKVNTDPNIAVIMSDKVQSSATYYKDGQEYNQLADMIVPGMFLVLFYLIICMFGNQMLTATVEEKENRISEMILTTIKSRTLITGKIFAFITLILIQALSIIGLTLASYLVASRFINLPNFDLSFIAFNPARIAIGAIVFMVSTLMFSGIMVAIGAAAPTAKEANQFLTVPLLLILAPLYVFGIVVSTPEAPIVQTMIYFPLTSPVITMLMNALGTLSISTAVICIIIMTVTTAVIFLIASRLFQAGAIEYHKRLRLLPAKKSAIK
ncbi:MAG: ABC transporter permease [Candidatus Saccharibacteria bacterium]|nr:ABC transporter permease [Candidatus Saccharibacteria bacterium]